MKLGTNEYGTVEFNEDEALNQHICLLGKSGSGKSAAAQRLALAMAEEGRIVIALDIHQVLSPENIFPPLREKMGEFSNIIDLEKEPLKLPLFTSLTKADGRQESSINTIGAIVDVIDRVYRLGEVQRAELRKACEFCMKNGWYHEQGMNGIKEALEMIGGKVAGRLLDKLYVLFEQKLFMDGKMPIQPGKINIIRLSHLDLSSQEVVAEIILSYIWRRSVFAMDDIKVVLYLDEFQNLDMKARSPLSLMLTEGRKFNLQLLLCTQSLYVGFSDAERKKVLQVGLLLYFRPTDLERRGIAALISNNQITEYALLLSILQVGEAVAVGSLLVNRRRTLRPIKVCFSEP
ncbi:MAG TPA: DUF87 domain-containing protein [Candidatus Enterocloster faecavium]|uniref:DUF87 domain-containing protein n=1 Tax=Candidatus Enterocloster faecavium TaxID=2838560 RepID=A0A9D2L7S4_9FIRM|nr:DUF87 domain-containing protein [Candidatus Enterocloster faecavium]